MMPTPEQAREHVSWMLGLVLARSSRRNAPFVFMFQTMYLPDVLSLALQRHDAPRDGAVQVGIPRRAAPDPDVRANRSALPPDRTGALRRTARSNSSASASPCPSASFSTSGTTRARSSPRSAMRPDHSGGEARRVERPAKALAAVGQMALSNYLLHSVVTSVLFLGWGFGLSGQLDYAGATARRRRDLDSPACSEPRMARALPLRPGRVALAIVDLLGAATDAA